MKKKNIIRITFITFITFITLIILLVPLIAMQFRSEVNWTLADFLIMGALVFGTTFLLEVWIDYTLKSKSKYKVLGVLAIVILFSWLWAEFGVGFFTNLGS